MGLNVGIVGLGWVGKSMFEMFPDAVVYDEPQIKETYPADYAAAVREGREQINKCDVAFVCVPTPNVGEGRLDTSIVEEVVGWCDSKLIVIRSTVDPGTTDALRNKTGKHIVMQPEYLGETPKHPMLNQTERPFVILGGEPEDRRKAIEVYTQAYNANTRIRQTSALEAEIIKLSENRAIAFKVAQCQELYDVCELAGVDYYTIRDAVYDDDPRFNLWWTFIYPDKRGMESKCIPKDPYAWCAWAESLGYDPLLTRTILNKNKEWVASNA